MVERDAVRRQIAMAAPPEAVWEALTEGERLSSWFGANVEIEARPGGAVRFRFADGTERRGVVQAADAPRRLVFRWTALRGSGFDLAAGDASTVEFALEPDGDGTRLVVTESPGILARAEALDRA